MKITKLLLLVSVAVVSALGSFVFAEGNNPAFSITVDAAYYPAHETNDGASIAYANINGPFSGVEGRVTGACNYVIPTPLGDNWLVSSANVELRGSLELTPVSLRPAFEVKFTPLPFLVFAAGTEIGSGWTFAPLGAQGIAYYDAKSGKYVDYSPFSHWYCNFYAQGVFQFDTGALIEGDWTHVVMMALYQVSYKMMSGTGSGDYWLWQTIGNKANGLQYYSSIVLAYQMPLPIYRVGVMAEFEGHYMAKDYGEYAETYDGDFMSINISPLAQFNFTEKDELSVLVGFASRRTYEDNSISSVDVVKTKTGREWYFNRLAVSYTHSF